MRRPRGASLDESFISERTLATRHIRVPAMAVVSHYPSCADGAPTRQFPASQPRRRGRRRRGSEAAQPGAVEAHLLGLGQHSIRSVVRGQLQATRARNPVRGANPRTVSGYCRRVSARQSAPCVFDGHSECRPPGLAPVAHKRSWRGSDGSRGRVLDSLMWPH